MKQYFIQLTCLTLIAFTLPVLCHAESIDQLRNSFQNPSHESTQVPFWFWNDSLSEDGIREQIDQMQSKGVHGFCIHARMGLSPEIGYMTERWLELARFAVEEAQRRGMMVYLYDEGMYPSGSANGKVVKGHPELASQGLRIERYHFEGPTNIEKQILLNNRETFVAAVLLKNSEQDGQYLPDSAKVLKNENPIQAEITDGDWTLFVFIQTPSEGVIRGVHWDQEDNRPGAPASADLLNPKATQRFIQLTHRKYYDALQEHFGETVRGIFTDEPSILGRRSKRGLKEWTYGFSSQLREILGYDFTPYLPFLWVEAKGELHEAVREDFEHAVATALNENYYRLLSEWCAEHDIVLTGHPEGGGEMRPQRYFQQPGQDVVWRWVLPGETSLEGEQSTTGKSASSMAIHLQRPIVINECYGAFGWRLTPGEMKWLADWLFVRGTNRLFPHAFYYSVRGKRIYERPPDLSWHNLWWEQYQQFSDYTNRMSWLVTGGQPVSDIAVWANNHAPWQTAKPLYQNQIDFAYLESSLADQVQIKNSEIAIGDGNYSVLILDHVEYASPEDYRYWLKWMNQGVTLVAYQSPLQPHPLRPVDQSKVNQLKNQLVKHSNYHEISSSNELLHTIQKAISSDIVCSPKAPYLRYAHRIKDGVDFYLITNEGDSTIKTNITFQQSTPPEIWDAETGAMALAPNAVINDESVAVSCELPPRSSRIYVFTSEESKLTKEDKQLQPATKMEITNDAWTLQIGEESVEKDLKRWDTFSQWEEYSGAGYYKKTVDIPSDILNKAEKVTLELDGVHNWASVSINGVDCGTRLWPPFSFDATEAIRSGENQLNVKVVNTRANELTDETYPSGLEGPVHVIFWDES